MSKATHKKLLEATRDLQFLNRLIENNGVIHLRKKSEDQLFEHLCKTVVSQQLSNKAADTIWNRISNISRLQHDSLFDFVSHENSENIKSCGLSKFKLKAIIGLKEALSTNKISKEIYSTSDPQIIIDEISKLWGFGKWSAEMTALFFFALPDVWSEDDVALRRGLNIISQKENTSPNDILYLMTPFKSFFSMHIWKGLDDGSIN